ncbi:MAG TPA: hypothetical protein VKR06_02230 [Ktedonosporobacter sp.]|nr:hypothetical protein [Ktedonosporobacter sp.]
MGAVSALLKPDEFARLRRHLLDHDTFRLIATYPHSSRLAPVSS